MKDIPHSVFLDLISPVLRKKYRKICWLPEQYGTECRASAFAFITNLGRFTAAGFTFLVGAGVRHFGSMGTPVGLTALAFVLGLALLPMGVETKGKPLPA